MRIYCFLKLNMTALRESKRSATFRWRNVLKAKAW